MKQYQVINSVSAALSKLITTEQLMAEIGLKAFVNADDFRNYMSEIDKITFQDLL